MVGNRNGTNHLNLRPSYNKNTIQKVNLHNSCLQRQRTLRQLWQSMDHLKSQNWFKTGDTI